MMTVYQPEVITKSTGCQLKALNKKQGCQIRTLTMTQGCKIEIHQQKKKADARYDNQRFLVFKIHLLWLLKEISI